MSLSKAFLAVLLLFVLQAGMFSGSGAHAAADATPGILQSTAQDDYLPTTFTNLSKLYWAIGKLSVGDNQAIDNFLRINECDLYMQYYQDDFEWNKIRQVTRDYIMKSLTLFPTRYEAIVPIYLDRYDEEHQRFNLAAESTYKDTRNIEVILNAKGKTCGMEGEIDLYPRNVILLLDRPLSVYAIPVTADIAKLYLERARRQYEKLPRHFQTGSYERVAYLRLKVKIIQYKATVSGRSGTKLASVVAQYEGYDVYADENKTMPLYSYTVDRKKSRHLRDSEQGGADDQTNPDTDADSGTAGSESAVAR